jgi:hypothetical protein
MWTALYRKPIFAIIGHWITPEFEKREEVLDFVELQGSYTEEAIDRAQAKTKALHDHGG